MNHSEEGPPERQLPRRPSSEHLRKQAKRLARDEGLILSAAQRKLAAQYGAPSWSALLESVDRARAKIRRPRVTAAPPKVAPPGRQNTALNVMLALATLPVLLPYLLVPEMLERFSDLSAALDLKARGIATMGLALFALNLVLVARWKLVDRWMLPLDQQYRLHHVIGGVALILLVLHPLKMSLKYAPESWIEVAEFLFSDSPWQNVLGIIALGFLVILLSVAFFRRGQYIRRVSHQWLALPFFLGGMHGLINGPDPVLAVYFLIGAAALFWRTLLKLYRRHEHLFTVEAVTPVSNDVTELSLRPAGPMPAFAPGQFVLLDIQGPDFVGHAQPFSITSGPSDDRLRFGIKSHGEFKRGVAKLSSGASVRVEGPFGGFTHLATSNRRQRWVAQGIGVAPFLAMARYLDETEDETYDVELHYAVDEAGDTAFARELAEIAERNPSFKFHPCAGPLGAEALKLSDTDIAEAEFLVCGPPAFVTGIARQFEAIGVAAKRIRSETFTVRGDDTGTPGMPPAVACALGAAALAIAVILVQGW